MERHAWIKSSAGRQTITGRYRADVAAEQPFPTTIMDSAAVTVVGMWRPNASLDSRARQSVSLSLCLAFCLRMIWLWACGAGDGAAGGPRGRLGAAG